MRTPSVTITDLHQPHVILVTSTQARKDVTMHAGACRSLRRTALSQSLSQSMRVRSGGRPSSDNPSATVSFAVPSETCTSAYHSSTCCRGRAPAFLLQC
jgi:hypothetical protein